MNAVGSRARRPDREGRQGDGNERDQHREADQPPHQPDIAAFQPFVDEVEAAIEGIGAAGLRPQPQGALGRLQRDRVDRADDSGRRDDERELAVELAHDPRKDGCRQEHAQQHQRDREDRPQQFVHRQRRGLFRLDPLLDIFGRALDHDDRVVDDDADGEDEREQREQVDAESQRGHRREGADDGDGHRGRRHQGRPPALQEHDDDEKHEHRRLDQRLVDLADGGLHEARGVERKRIGDPAGKVRGEPLHLGFDGLRDIERVGVRQLKDGDARRRLAVHVEKLAVGLGAELDAADIADAGHRAAGCALCLDRDLLELRHGGEPTAQVDRELEGLICRGRRRTDLPGRHLLALLLDRIDDVDRYQRARLHLLGIEPHAHAVLADPEHQRVADAGNA